jgi:hypothetical protein
MERSAYQQPVDIVLYILPSVPGKHQLFNHAIIGVNMEENQTVPSLPASSGQTVGAASPTGQQPGMVDPSQAAGQSPLKDQQSSKGMIIAAAVVMVAVIILIAATVWLMTSSVETTAKVRDVFIIFMALESLVIGVALVILIVQLATLINLLQNEIKPIISTTNETVNTLRGTVTFLSENLTEPVIKFNSYMAGAKQFFDLMRPGKTKR